MITIKKIINVKTIGTLQRMLPLVIFMMVGMNTTLTQAAEEITIYYIPEAPASSAVSETAPGVDTLTAPETQKDSLYNVASEVEALLNDPTLMLNEIYIHRTIPIYDQKEDSKHIGEIHAQTVKLIRREDHWFLIETWLGFKWIDLNTANISVLLDVPSYDQRKLGYPTGCEIIAIAMMINYQTKVAASTLVSEMPRSQNPAYGFRGDPKMKGGFTIYPQALLGLVEKYAGSAVDMTGCEIDDLKKKLNDNIPVVTWLHGLGFNVHAICLTGYDEEGFYYNDPWTGQKNSYIKYQAFYDAWNNPIYDRLFGYAYPTKKTLSY